MLGFDLRSAFSPLLSSSEGSDRSGGWDEEQRAIGSQVGQLSITSGARLWSPKRRVTEVTKCQVPLMSPR